MRHMPLSPHLQGLSTFPQNLNMAKNVGHSNLHALESGILEPVPWSGAGTSAKAKTSTRRTIYPATSSEYLWQGLSPEGMHTPRGTWKDPRGYMQAGGDGVLPPTPLLCHLPGAGPLEGGGRRGRAAVSLCRLHRHRPASRLWGEVWGRACMRQWPPPPNAATAARRFHMAGRTCGYMGC